MVSANSTDYQPPGKSQIVPNCRNLPCGYMAADGAINRGHACELCGRRRSENFISTTWGYRHSCRQCAESIEENGESK